MISKMSLPTSAASPSKASGNPTGRGRRKLAGPFFLATLSALVLGATLVAG